MSYRAALIGCGRIGSELADDPRGVGISTHAGAYAACPATDLVAVCDLDAGRLAACARRWGVAASYQNVEHLLDEQRPELVSICTPDASHYAVARQVLASPGIRGVLLEKPLAVLPEQARELVAEARTRGIVLAVNYTRRYAGSHVQLARLVRDGAFGALQSVGGYYTKGLLHNGTHWIDLARLLVGDIEWVQGYDFRQEPGPDPALDAILGFRGGLGGHLRACGAAHFALFELDLVGETGRVRVLDMGHSLETYLVADSPRYSGYRELQRANTWSGQLGSELLTAVHDLVRCVETGAKPQCTADDAALALEIAWAVRKSAETRTPQRLEAVR